MKTALFTNFTSEEFTGYWDGKGKKFAPGQSLYMPDYLAAHFAKHLVNRELLRRKPDGTLVIKNGDKFVSPKKPEQVPVYMDLFNKAFTPDESEELGSQADDIDALIGAANKNHKKDDAAKAAGGSPELQTPVDLDDDEDDSEESFGAKPVELTIETPGNTPAAN